MRRTLDSGLDEARGRLDELARLGIDLDLVTDELEEEGVRAFAHSYADLEDAVSGEPQKAQPAADST